jgi:hypothetical protein
MDLLQRFHVPRSSFALQLMMMLLRVRLPLATTTSGIPRCRATMMMKVEE